MSGFVSILIFYICLVESSAFSQQNHYANPIDSLIKALEKSLSDTNKVKILRELGKKTSEEYPDSALAYYNQSLSLSKKISYKIGEGKSYFDIGSIYYAQANYSLSQENYLNALAIYKGINDSLRISKTLHNLGMVTDRTGNKQKALEYHLQALNIAETVRDTTTIINVLNSIGVIFLGQNNYPKAEYYFLKCMKLNNATSNKHGLSFNYNNLALILIEQGDTAQALEYYEKALSIEKELNNKDGMFGSFGNIGNIYYEKKEYKTALALFKQALNIAHQLNNDYRLAEIYTNVGRTYYDLNDINNAIQYSDSAIRKAIQLNVKNLIINPALTLTDAYSQIDNYEKALHFHRIYSDYKDSLINQENAKMITEMEAKYDAEKKQNEIELLNKEKEKQATITAEQNKRKNIIIWSVISGLLLVIIFSIFLFNRFQVTRMQKNIIAEKNKEITDSINYAKRIQQAKLPKKEEIISVLPQNFILFKPKDIVSGDFYFYSTLENSMGCIIAAADCTGHGVPGAFISMICSEKLNDALKQTSHPGEILSLVNKAIKLSLKQTESTESTKDGMDIALCSIDTVNRIVKYAGANRPIWIIRKTPLPNGEGQGAGLEEIKATKKAIGGFTEDSQHFNTHEIKLQQGDTFYIFSDGYADTFSGHDDKKLSTKKFKQILLDIQNKTMQEQEQHLDNFIENWKAGIEQMDDILVIGIKIS